MCDGVAILRSEFSDDLLRRYRLDYRIHTRARRAEQEIRFLARDRWPVLPVWHDGQLAIYPWGNRDRTARLPRSGWCLEEELNAGTWEWLKPIPIEIPATYALTQGVWYPVTQGIQGVLVGDGRGRPHVYMRIKAATHYFRIMTRSERMPLLIAQQI